MAQPEENTLLEVTKPEQAHVRQDSQERLLEEYEAESSRPREATELQDVSTDVPNREDYPAAGLRRLQASRRETQKRFQPLRRFWRRQVAVTVPHDLCRDHLALERTFLSWMRTSLALAMLGTTVAQLFRLQGNGNDNDDSKLRDERSHVGIPVAAAFNGAAMLVTLIGAHRFWKQQNAMVRSKIHKAGWEVWSVGILFIALVGALLGVTLYAGSGD